MSEQLKNKIVNPEVHFDKPKDVVQDDALSHQEKKKALNTWEQDERQLLTASNEGMSGSDEGQRKKEANRHPIKRWRFAHPRGVACKIARNIDLSLLKPLKVGETPGFLWLSEFEGTGAEIAPEPTGHGLPLSKCEAYNRVNDQHSGSS